MEASISFKSISKKILNDTLFADLSFGVEKGTKFAIVGPNESGKSTIIKLICGLVHKNKGVVYVNGSDPSIRPIEVKCNIGYMPQKIDFNKSITLLENIILYGELYGISQNNSKNEALKLCESLGINNYINKKIEYLPSNILRIGMFVRSLVHNPEILLLDEPTLSLDPFYRDLLWNYIDSKCKSKTILFCTQNYTEAETYSDRIAVLFKGEIRLIGNYNYLIENTHNLYKFSITFKNTISDDLIKFIRLNPKLVKPRISNNNITFLCEDKEEYLKLLRDFIKYEIVDFHSSKISLEDILKGVK